VKRETFKNDKATREWLDSQKKRTRSTYKTAWKYFLEYAEMTGDQILADRKNDKVFRWEKKTLDFKRWMIEQKQQSENSARTATTTVRAFFGYYRIPLVFRKTEKARLREARRKQEDYRFSREDLKRMVDVADLTGKYIVAAGKSFGLRAGDFLALKRGDLEPYIDREPPISIGEYMTRKETVPSYPFIDSDAKPIIKMMIGQMNREGRTQPNRRMLKYADSIQLSRVLQRLADKAGVKYGNKNVRFHCLRKFLIDHLSSHMSTEKWKQIVGKKITEGAYVSPDSLREDYARTMSETVFTKVVSEDETELRMMEKMLQAFGLGDKYRIRRKNAERLKKAPLSIIEQKKIADRILKERGEQENNKETATNGGCSNGQHCQRIVSEAELGGLLAQGWRVAAVLPSGNVVVSNE
jgi:integrase